VNAHQVTKDFERAIAEYTGAPYVVCVNSCTMALLLAVAWHLRGHQRNLAVAEEIRRPRILKPPIEIPKRTYVSVPMSIIHAGGRPTFRDAGWDGYYRLAPLPVYDSARWFSSGTFRAIRAFNGQRSLMACVSFHASKTLGIEQGGAILHDSAEADQWLRRARFDGRTEGVPPIKDTFTQVGWHCYMNPSTAAQGLMKIAVLPKHNDPLPNDDYPDLSEMEIFK